MQLAPDVLDGFLPLPPSPELPRWVLPSLLAAALAAAVGLSVDGYVASVNRQLAAAQRREAIAHATSQKKLEVKLRAALAASAVAHEIQQPLGRLQLASDMAAAVGTWNPTSLAMLSREVSQISRTIDKMHALLRSVQTSHTKVNVCHVVLHTDDPSSVEAAVMINDHPRVSTAGLTAGLVKAGHREVNPRNAVLSAISRVSNTKPVPRIRP